MELKSSEKLSIRYHDIFSYPLKKEDLKRWRPRYFGNFKVDKQFLFSDKFYFLKGRKKVIKKRLENEVYSRKKMVIAGRAAKLISKVSTVLFVGVTGSLAMENADKNSDIDFLIITKKNSVWLSRLLVYFLLKIRGFKIRKPNIKNEKDKLCLNMWLEADKMNWPKRSRNIYTAHEILQVVPLLNKYGVYHRFLRSNDWVYSFWKKSVNKHNNDTVSDNLSLSYKSNLLISLFNKVAFLVQYVYMKSKTTNEIVTKDTAIFHTNDWSKYVTEKLSH